MTMASIQQSESQPLTFGKTHLSLHEVGACFTMEIRNVHSSHYSQILVMVFWHRTQLNPECM